MTVIVGADERLISYNRFSIDRAILKLPTSGNEVALAERIWDEVDPDYAAGLDYMRTDSYERFFIDENGEEVLLPIRWVKFAHRNGSYNWVSIGPGNQIIEVERESRWNYMRNRRATEEWNYDNWVLAREGKGPQLKAPEALA